MNSEALKQKLDALKEKYYQSLYDNNAQQNLNELLKKSLSRLALVAKGIDPIIDEQLSTLRSELKNKTPDSVKLESFITVVENSIRTIDYKASESVISGLAIADAFKALNLPEIYSEEHQRLIKELSQGSESTLPIIIEKVITLLNSVVNSTTTHSKDLSLEASPDKLSSSGHEQSLNTNESYLKSSQILIQLIEKLSLPVRLNQQVSTIKTKLIAEVDSESLPKVIDKLADIINSFGEMLLSEKKEYENFLQSLSNRLNYLDKHIDENCYIESQAFSDRNELGNIVEEETENLLSIINTTEDLTEARELVINQVNLLNQQFQSYREADKNNFESSQKEINKLKERINKMEQESVELRKAVLKSRERSLRDPLTQIWNRQGLNDILKSEFIKFQHLDTSLSLVLWDIDHFKSINDKYGHSAGDKVLKTIAQLLVSLTREDDAIARYGGEEFIGVFPRVGLDNLFALAEKIRLKIAQTRFHYDNEIVKVTISAGIATFKKQDTIESVFERADKALYQAKSQNRNQCIIFD